MHYKHITEKQIRDLHSAGLLTHEIANRLGMKYAFMDSRLHKYGLRSNYSVQRSIKIVSKTKARCSRCNRILSLTKFLWGRKGRRNEYRFTYCLDCRRKQAYLNLNSDVTRFIKNIFNRIKLRAIKNGVSFTISFDQFKRIYEQQKGLCFYTGFATKTKVGEGNTKHSLSVDQIQPGEGYTPDNIVFCTRHANTMKANLSLDELKKWIPYFYAKLEDAGRV